MTNLKLYVEQTKQGMWCGITKEHEGHYANGMADTKEGMLADVRLCIEDHQANEGRNSQFWQNINAQTVYFDIVEGIPQ